MNSTPLSLRLPGLLVACLTSSLPALAQQRLFTVNTPADTVDVSPGDGIAADSSGKTSLRAAVQEANALGGMAVIYLKVEGSYSLDRIGNGEDGAMTGDLDVTSQISLQGRDATIDAMGADRAFDVLPGGRLLVHRLHVQNGFVMDASGGAYRNAGDLLLSRASVSDSVAMGAGASGGALFNDGGFLAIDDVEISGCSAERAGGAIEANAGTTIVDRCEISANTAGPNPGNGGGLHLTGEGYVDVRSSRFLDNSAAREGGGLWNSSVGTMVLDDCDIIGNEATGAASDDGGGGLFNDGGLMEVVDCTVKQNEALVGAGSGGGAFNNGGLLIASTSEFEMNLSNRAGGGVECLGGSTVLWRCGLLSNQTGASPGNGGGLHLTGTGQVSVDDSLVSGNLASAEGGGLWNSSGGTMSVVGSTLVGNRASGDEATQSGGGLFNDGGFMMVQSSGIQGNVADGASGSGGGILNDQGQLIVRRTRISQNSSNRAGGGIEANVGVTLLTQVALTANSTGDAPGNGGGLHLTGAGSVSIDAGLVNLNDAANEGGGLWNSATGTMIVTGTHIAGNTAPFGPDVFNDGGTFTIDGNDVL